MRPAISYISFVAPDHQKWQYFLPIALLIILSNISLSGAQTIPGEITIGEDANIWIEGSAGPVDFSCRAKSLSGKGKINNRTNPRASVQQQGEVRISVSLPVKTLDCGKRAMNNDMYGALKAERHPSITYHLLDATLAEDSTGSTGDWMTINTRGIMEIGGVPDTTSVLVKGKVVENNRFRVRGSKEIHMDTYDIDPPSKMLGLIRARKDLTVHFNVTVILQEDRESDL